MRLVFLCLAAWLVLVVAALASGSVDDPPSGKSRAIIAN
jgi:hypothetical protein